MTGYLNRAWAFCLCLLFVLLFCPLEALASGARAKVDGDLVTVFWQGDNDPASSTVVLSGPETRSETFEGSRIRFDDLEPGSYEVSVTRAGRVETLSVLVPDQEYSVSDRSGTGKFASKAVSLQLAGLETSLYPGIALQFRPLDSNGNIVKTSLSPEGFSIYEEGRLVPSFSVLSPYSSEANRTADLVVVFDSTGSMWSEIAMLKANIGGFLEKVTGSGIDLRYRLVSYKDDVESSWGWTTSPGEFESQIGSLTASGGIEIPEDGFEAMKTASDYDFRPGAFRFILLVTDAPSWERRDENGNDTPTMEEMSSSLKDNSVVLYAVTCDDSNDEGQYNGDGSLTDVTGGKWYDLMGDFSSVIDDIGDIIGSTYLLSYTTPNTPDTIEGTDDVIDVSVRYDGLQSLATSYSVNMPPVAVVYPPAAVASSAGASLPFEVYFSDPDDDGISDLRFYYRFDGGEQKYVDFNEADLSGSGGKFTVQIPSGEVPESSGVFYSVRVTDGQGARGVFPKDGSYAYLDRNNSSFSISGSTSYVEDNGDMVVDVELSNLSDGDVPSFFAYKSPGSDFSGVAGSAVSAAKYGTRYRVVLDSESLKGIGSVFIGVNCGGVLQKTKVFYYSGDVTSSIRGKADTVILTNLSDMQGDTSSLKEAISALVKAAWDVDEATGFPGVTDNSGYNMLPIVVDLQDQQVMTGASSVFQISWGGVSRGSAASIISGMGDLLRVNGFDLRDSMSLVIAGSNSVIPYGVAYNKYYEMSDESQWFLKQLGTAKAPALKDFYSGNYYPSDVQYRDRFRTGRLVETAADIASLLDKYRQDRGYLVTSRKMLYLSGYDENDETNGFLVGKWMRDYMAGSPGGWVKDSRSTYSPAGGFSGSTVVSALNSLGSGMAFIAGHGNYYLNQNGKDESDLFYSASSPWRNDLSSVSGLEDSLIFSNACHNGLNFRASGGAYADFPEAYAGVGRGLGVYVANSSYGIYEVSGISYGDRLFQNAVTDITEGDSDTVVYDSVFRGVALPYSSDTNRDIMSRPQFYGVPTYRVGPASESRGSGRMLAASGTLQNKNFFSHRVENSLSSMRLDLSFSMAETDYTVMDNGGFSVHGVDQRGAYGRPALTFSVPVPAGSALKGSLSVSLAGSDEREYSGVIREMVASSAFESDLVLTTESYDEMALADAVVEGGRLIVTVWPVQYDTSNSSLRVAENLSVSVSLQYPSAGCSFTAVADSDMDGLPDYWERGYGLDGNDPSGVNGYAGDMDGDGLSNLQEFCRGSDPVLPAVSSDPAVFSDSQDYDSAEGSSAGGCMVGQSYGSLLFLLAGMVLLRRRN